LRVRLLLGEVQLSRAVDGVDASVASRRVVRSGVRPPPLEYRRDRSSRRARRGVRRVAVRGRSSRGPEREVAKRRLNVGRRVRPFVDDRGRGALAVDAGVFVDVRRPLRRVGDVRRMTGRRGSLADHVRERVGVGRVGVVGRQAVEARVLSAVATAVEERRRLKPARRVVEAGEGAPRRRRTRRTVGEGGSGRAGVVGRGGGSVEGAAELANGESVGSFERVREGRARLEGRLLLVRRVVDAGFAVATVRGRGGRNVRLREKVGQFDALAPPIPRSSASSPSCALASLGCRS
jgi:hypothetical protein